ncbi:hypothetical protein EMPS_11614 [Entomortierella parvispora]|uniref:Pyrimidine 5'-nucleotidase n=1 Tax=Entomortierella parvispora TaxID=205924 RepID=A0A9P3M2C5_9FUNG|nr:hypothetical protein EMPS_11614 [Entomortierella parvispora]
MKDRIENYFKASGIPHSEVESLVQHYYITYGLAIRGLVERHPEVDIRDYDEKVDGALPLEIILKEDPALRSMIQSMNIGKKWLFTNAGESHAKRVVSILGLDGLFHGVTFCNYLAPQFVCKPDRRSFEKAMEEAGVTDPSLCYFVDDSSANVEMATQVGWNAVHLLEDPAEDSSSGKFRIHSIKDLPQVMPELWETSMK